MPLSVGQEGSHTTQLARECSTSLCCLCRFNSLTPDELSKLALGAATAAQSLGLNLQASDVGVSGVYYTIASGSSGRKLQVRLCQALHVHLHWAAAVCGHLEPLCSLRCRQGLSAGASDRALADYIAVQALQRPVLS